MRKFKTGATRNEDKDRLDFEGFLSPLVLKAYGNYMHKHRKQADGKLRDSDNWKKGMDKSVYMKSLLRHVMALWRTHRYGEGEDIMDSLCAIMFNTQGYLFELLAKKNPKMRPNKRR